MNDGAAHAEGRRPKASRGGNRWGDVQRYRVRYGDLSAAETVCELRQGGAKSPRGQKAFRDDLHALPQLREGRGTRHVRADVEPLRRRRPKGSFCGGVRVFPKICENRASFGARRTSIRSSPRRRSCFLARGWSCRECRMRRPDAILFGFWAVFHSDFQNCPR